jgi:hypothetical protein
MLQTMLSVLRRKTSNDMQPMRRRYPRREVDQCVSVIEGKMFPVLDWSPAGILLHADDRLFTLDQDMDVAIKFRLGQRILDIAHEGRVVRKKNNKIAIEFAPLSQIVRRTFQQVIDDHAARQFADSQAG